jgi:pimeloyl-ACP methyl ester carboxylesterase
MHCTEEGQVVLVEGTRTTFDLNIAVEQWLAKERRKYWSNTPKQEALERVREVTGIRPLDQLPDPESRVAGVVKRDSYDIEKLIVEPEDGIWLPGLHFFPDKPSGNPVLYVHGGGKHVDAGPGGRIRDLVNQGRRVLAIDVRGLGETLRLGDREDYVEYFGPSYRDGSLAYMLGTSFLAMRAEDILASARVLQGLAKGDSSTSVELVAIGEMGPPALHAAALEQDLFASLTLEQSLASWSNVVHTPVTQNQWTNLVHGALRVYDLPDLVAAVPVEKVTVSEPLDAAGNPTK